MKQFLKDIAIIGAGQGAPQGEENYCNDGIPFIKAGNLQELLDGKDISLIQQVSEIVAKKHRLKLYSKGTILFAKSGMSCMKGYVYVLPQDAYVVSHLACITPNEQISEYLRYYFLYHKPNQLVKDASYPSISLTDIGNLEIDIKSVAERSAIVNELNLLDSIISLRQRELQKLDDLIKARFVELTERANTIPTRMGDIATYVNGYAFKPEQWEDNGYPIIRIQNLNDANAPYNYYSGDLAEKYLIHNGDVLVSWATHLEAYIWKGQEAWLNQHIFKAVFDKMDVDKTYYVYASEEALRQAFRNAHGFKPTMEHIKKSDFDAAIVRLPDIETQKEFADFVNQVDKSKSAVQKSLDEAQLLFDSLMQQYFG